MDFISRLISLALLPLIFLSGLPPAQAAFFFQSGATSSGGTKGATLAARGYRALPLGQSEALVYNQVGNLTQRTYFNGTVSSFTYDTLNRLHSRTSNHADAAASNVSFTYTASGQRATMTDASGTTTYGYDARDRLTSKATPQGTLGYTYDNAGHVSTIGTNHAQGASVSYAYDALNRLGSVTDAQLGLTSYAYDDVGNLGSFATPNGVAHAYAYSSVNRLTSMGVWSSAGGSPTVLAGYTYTLAAGGQRLTAAETGPGILLTAPTTTRNVGYTYDTLIRLTQEDITGAPNHNGTVGYTLDPVGNRLTRTSTVAGLTNQVFTYDANDRLNTDTYDANGNTKQGRITLDATGAETTAQTASDNYDSENRLTSRTGPSSVQIVYDGDGHKVRETVNGQEISYLIDDLNPTGYAQVIEELQNGALVRTYTYGHDLLAQDQRDGGGNWSATFYGYDGHGSVRFLTDDQGQITDSYTYDAFGTLLTSQGTTFNRYRYCGEQFDDALGLYYNRARFLNAASGRFWNMDSYEGALDDPTSLHKYLYVGSDPINHYDPSGFIEGGLGGESIKNGIIAVFAQRVAVAATNYIVRASVVALQSQVWVWENATAIEFWMLVGGVGLETADYVSGLAEEWATNEEVPPQGPTTRGVWAENKTSANLGGNFETIDDYEHSMKLGTSIRTHTATSPEDLKKKIRSDLREMHGIEKRELRGTDRNGVYRVLPAGSVEQKALVVGIEEEMATGVVQSSFRAWVAETAREFRTTIRIAPIRGWKRGR